MLAFALISEVPFDIGFFSAYSRMEDTFPFYLKYQNVFFTLFLGLLTLVCLERFSCKSDLPVDRIKSAVLQVLSVVLFSGIAEGIHCDYGMQGILFISAFYICRNHRIYQVLLFLLAYMGTTGNQPPLCTLLACLLILLYNGKRGKLKLKYFFYVFYPAHILVLYLIQIGLGKYLLKWLIAVCREIKPEQTPLGTKGRTSILSYREYRASCGASFSVSRRKLPDLECFRHFVPTRWLHPLAPLMRLSPVDLPSANSMKCCSPPASLILKIQLKGEA